MVFSQVCSLTPSLQLFEVRARQLLTRLLPQPLNLPPHLQYDLYFASSGLSHHFCTYLWKAFLLFYSTEYTTILSHAFLPSPSQLFLLKHLSSLFSSWLTPNGSRIISVRKLLCPSCLSAGPFFCHSQRMTVCEHLPSRITHSGLFLSLFHQAMSLL